MRRYCSHTLLQLVNSVHLHVVCAVIASVRDVHLYVCTTIASVHSVHLHVCPVIASVLDVHLHV